MTNSHSNIMLGCLGAVCASTLLCGQAVAADQTSTSTTSTTTTKAASKASTTKSTASAAKTDDTVVVVGDNANTQEFRPNSVDMGPLGNIKLHDLPYSAYVMDEKMLKDRNIKGLSDAIKYDSSAAIEARGGMDLGRPQTRGIEGSVMQNTHVDGLNVVSTTFQPMEFYQRLEIIHSLTGAIYGPATPSGDFNYEFKRPTHNYFNDLSVGIDSNGAREVSLDTAGTPIQYAGYRFIAIKEQGPGYVSGSSVKRKAFGAALDFYLTDSTTVELNGSYYRNKKFGFPGAFSFTASSGLPSALDATKKGYGESYAGTDLKTSMLSAKIKQTINEDWKAEGGILTQTVDRTQLGVTNTINGDGTITQSMSTKAIAGRFKVQSNEERLNGHFYTGNVEHKMTIGETGYEWKIASATGNSGSTVKLGTSDIDDPDTYDAPTFYSNGYLVYRSRTTSQSGILGDVINWNDQWSSIVVGAYNHFDSYSSSANYHKGGFSSTESLMYKPVKETMTYVAYSDTLEAGQVVTTSTYSNYGEILAPYRSRQIETGLKQNFGNFDGNLALFRIKRPLAYAADNVYAVQGMQRNYGAEMGLNGNVTRQIKISANTTLLNAKLTHAATATNNGKRVVGVPKVQANFLTEYDFDAIQGLSVNANVHYVGNRAGTISNTVWLGSYTTLDLGAKYVTKRFYNKEITFRLNVDNVTNKRYWASAFAGNIYGDTSSSDGGSAFLGTPLQVNFTTSIAF